MQPMQPMQPMQTRQPMQNTLHKNQYYIVSTLKRYREITKQKMLLERGRQDNQHRYNVARQKNKIYSTLISMVLHDGITETINYALQLYAKLPNISLEAVSQNGIGVKETIQACEKALESFFLLTKVNSHALEISKKQRSVSL